MTDGFITISGYLNVVAGAALFIYGYAIEIFLPFFIVAGLIYSLGYVLIGVGILKAGVLPGFAGILIAVGAPTYGLGSIFGKRQA